MKVLYKCENCLYQTDRLLNYKRHEQRKTHCYIKTKDIVNKIEHGANVNADGANVNADGANVNAGGANVNAGGANVNADEENVIISLKNKCMKCNKSFVRRIDCKKHEERCDGLDTLQCKICLKVFATRQGKHQHLQYVKCNPPSTTQQVINNNITNNTNNTNYNNNITNNINIVRVNFGEECLDKICQGKKYMKKVKELIKSGKYAIPSSIEEIYFNDESVENQTIKKGDKSF
jgi:hypothetical protein